MALTSIERNGIALGYATMAMITAIENAPAHSLTGLAVKARVILNESSPLDEDDMLPRMSIFLARQIVALADKQAT